jgi:hypothetical protein
VLLATNPAGHTVEVTTRTTWIVPQADGGTVTNFTMAHAANNAQSAPLSNANRANWTFSNNRLLYAHGWVLGFAAMQPGVMAPSTTPGVSEAAL